MHRNELVKIRAHWIGKWEAATLAHSSSPVYLGEAITKGSLSQLPLFRNETERERGGKGGRGATYPRRRDAAVMT